MTPNTAILLVFFLLAAGSLTAMAATESEVYSALERLKVGIDTQQVTQAVVDGMIKAIDPLGGIVEESSADAATAQPTAEEWEEGIFYIRPAAIGEYADKHVLDRVLDWAGGGGKGLIVDLRGVGGNSIDAAEAIGAVLAGGTPPHTIIGGAGTPVQTRTSTEAGGRSAGLPTIVLVDGKTSGMAELLAALVQGRPGMLLLGEKTMGDMAIRTLEPLNSSQQLYIASARVVLGKEPRAVMPVEPDIVSPALPDTAVSYPPENVPGAKPLSEKALSSRSLMHRTAEDIALRRAADILLGVEVVRRPAGLAAKGENDSDAQSSADQGAEQD